MLTLQIFSPEDNTTVSSAVISAVGRASPDATVSVNGQLVELDPSGNFETALHLDEGPNLIEAIASDLAGDVRSSVLTVIFTQQQEGLFGVVTNVVTLPPGGLSEITLRTTAGRTQVVEAGVDTFVRIPGKETAFATDISQDDSVAVLGTRLDANRLSAISILVKPQVPVVHAHITGSVLEASEDQVSIMDRDGNVISADLLVDKGEIDRAKIVTAVVRQDLKAGNLFVVGLEPADMNLDRGSDALRTAVQAGAQQNEGNLKVRLREATTGYLTTLQENLNRTDPGSSLFSDQTLALTNALESLDSLLSELDMPGPRLKLTGVITDIDQTGRTVSVGPQVGPEVRVKLLRAILGATAIVLYGQEARFEKLEPGQHLGQRIESIYDARTEEAYSINIIFPALGESLVRSLLEQVETGELEGTVSEVNPSAVPPVVMVRLATQETVALTVTPETRIRVGDQPAEVGRLFRGVPVKARYDPSTMAALNIETSDVKPGQASFEGVVKSVIRKFNPEIGVPGSTDNENISIATLAGEAITLNITDATIIERDGLRVNIFGIKLGDLVRSTSRYNTRTREVQRLVVKAPVLQGTVRGKTTTPGNRDYLTLSTDELNLVTVLLEQATDFTPLDARDRVVSGTYNPSRQKASGLVVEPPSTVGAVGTITQLDKDKGIATVTPAVGEPVVVLIPLKRGIVIIDGSSKPLKAATEVAFYTFEDLDEGDRVQVVFFRANSKQVVRIIVRSQ